LKQRRELSSFILRKLVAAIPLLLGVTLVTFTLTVYFGPDPTYTMLGKNPTEAEIESVRRELGLDRPFLVRYGNYLSRLARLDLGHTETTGERVSGVLARTIPVSIMLLVPGFVLGTSLALWLAMVAAWRRGSRLDRLITGVSVIGMSLSFVIVIIALQAVFGVWLGWFPVRGWDVQGPLSYLAHVTVPTLAFILGSIGYNTRFFRAMLVNAMSSDHVRTARAYGASPTRILLQHALRASLLPIITRIVFTVPALVVSGSLLIESHFSIPGIGRVTYQAILSGDQPLLMAVVGLSAVLFALSVTVADLLSRVADPRIRLA
jgi:peptide/nickel transport system permease protein